MDFTIETVSSQVMGGWREQDEKAEKGRNDEKMLEIPKRVC
jgi:hypothetical protein